MFDTLMTQETTSDTDGAYETLIEHFQCSMDALEQAKSLSDTMLQLTALKESVEKFGVTESLLSLALTYLVSVITKTMRLAVNDTMEASHAAHAITSNLEDHVEK